MARHSVLPRRAIAAQHGHILRRERRAKSTPLTLTTHDLEQGASFSKDVLGMAAIGRGGGPHFSLSHGNLRLTIRACTQRDDPDVGAHRAECRAMHHIGFLVDHVLVCADRMEQAGATRLTPLDTTGRGGPSRRGQRPSHAKGKWRGPNGVLSDNSEGGGGMLGRPSKSAGGLPSCGPGGRS